MCVKLSQTFSKIDSILRHQVIRQRWGSCQWFPDVVDAQNAHFEPLHAPFLSQPCTICGMNIALNPPMALTRKPRLPLRLGSTVALFTLFFSLGPLFWVKGKSQRTHSDRLTLHPSHLTTCLNIMPAYFNSVLKPNIFINTRQLQ